MSEGSEALSGRILTVLGPIAPKDAGKTLAHEHLCCNAEALMVKDKVPFEKYCGSNITQGILWWISQHPYSNLQNAHHFEEKMAITEEVKFFKENGGGTIVENSTVGLQRDVQFLRQLSKDTGVHVVAGTGYYVEPSRPQTLKMTQEEMAVAMTTEILEGCEGTGIRTGIVGEIGCNWPLFSSEKTAIQASAQVEKEIGCPVTIHPGRNHQSPWDIIRIYQEAGGHADRLVMSHMDRTICEIPELLEFAKLGCYIDYDLFGIETSNYQLKPDTDMPSDAERLDRIKALVDAGYEDWVTVGQDIHTKHRLMKFGGHGYSHILLHVVPKMRIKGFSEEVITKILENNPQKWLTFR